MIFISPAFPKMWWLPRMRFNVHPLSVSNRQISLPVIGVIGQSREPQLPAAVRGLQSATLQDIPKQLHEDFPSTRRPSRLANSNLAALELLPKSRLPVRVE